ncbi:S1C family serine protease [Roseospira marina]|nr:serine protease [Roseospira marina]MBB4313740.1 S1-C subfamily serine protease [Roseospira marina]MBB5086902.1 S1-C subfamily serine protease [Roseospira marina]
MGSEQKRRGAHARKGLSESTSGAALHHDGRTNRVRRGWRGGVLAAALLAACAGPVPLHEVPPRPEVPPLTPAQQAAVGTVALADVAVSADAETGRCRLDAVCGPGGPVRPWSESRDVTEPLRTVFRATLGETLGFRVAGDPDDLFGYARAHADAEFQLAARFRSVRYDLCREVNLLGFPVGTSGAASADIAVQLLDQKTGQVAYQTRVTARATLDDPLGSGAEERLRAAVFADALHRLAADNGFRRALVSGIPSHDALRRAEGVPAPGPYGALPSTADGWGAAWSAGASPGVHPTASYGTPTAYAGFGGGGLSAPSAAFATGSPGGLTLSGPPLFAEPLALNVEQVRAATVTVLGMAGHGSGFFLTRDGWVLTNAHVVAGGDVFRLRLVDGREVWARVERRHPRRDVALLKAIGQGFAALPLRPTLAQASETAYAIGTPRNRGLGQSVSQGIISAYRPQGLDGLDVYQATTPIHPGNSGGPLVDAWGNVVALAVAMLSDSRQGVGFFIPVHDAVRHVGVRVINPMPGQMRGPAVAVAPPVGFAGPPPSSAAHPGASYPGPSYPGAAPAGYPAGSPYPSLPPSAGAGPCGGGPCPSGAYGAGYARY